MPGAPARPRSMGLDITVYKSFRPATAEELALYNAQPEDERSDWASDNDFDEPYINPHFPGREAGLPEGLLKIDYADAGFSAGSYGGYNQWRNQLAAMAGYDKAWRSNPTPGPFMELIIFADNEGVIGPEVSAKLARDFAEWQERAEAYAQTLRDDDTRDDRDGDWFIRKYGEWRRAFEAASGTGYVDFH